MRLQLICAIVLFAATGRAEQLPQNTSGEAVFRGNYWRDRNTRVLNPAVDVRQDLPRGVNVGAHYLLDAITSASVASGAAADMPFTELRHEAGFGIAVPIARKHRIAANYSYSTESDYFSHQAGLRAIFNVLKDNSTLMLGVDYGHNTVGKRLTPSTYLTLGKLQTVHLVGLWTQTLSRYALLTASYEVSFLQGYQNNPYRPIFVALSGSLSKRETENLPTSRIRHVIALSSHVLVPTENLLVPHVTLRPGLRVHIDSWGMKAFNPELALHVPIGPTELRLLLSYYDQSQTEFYRADGECRPGQIPNIPIYCNGAVDWGTTTDADGNTVPLQVYTSDVKLGSYRTYTWELGFKWRLSMLRRLGLLGERLSRSILELTGGMWFANDGVGWQYGIPLTKNDPLAPAGCSSACAAGFANLGLSVPL